MPRTAILVPTIGRASLRNCLYELLEQWSDERVVVLAQRDIESAAAIFDEVDPRVWLDGRPLWTFHALADTVDGYGHDSRNVALAHIVEPDVRWIWSVDDDDVPAPGALDALADAARVDAPVTVFRATWGPGHPAHGVTLWRERGLVAKGEVATPMLFWRRHPEVRYGVNYFGDWQLAEALLGVYPREEWAWRDEVVCVVRPEASA